MVGAPALGRVHDQGGLQAQAQVEQVVMHRPHRQQGRDRGGGGIDAGGLATLAPAIRQQHDHGARSHGRLGLPAQPFHGLLQAARPRQHGEQGREGGHGQALVGDGRQFRLIQHRGIEVQHPGGSRHRTQGRTPLAQVHLQAHHQLFAQGVDRRVGDLGEALLEIVVKEVGFAGEHRQGDVIPHAVGGFLAGPRHVVDHQLHVLGGEAEGGLLAQQLQFAQLALLQPGLGVQLAPVLGQPGAIGMAGGCLGLHLPVAQQAALLQVNGQHLARAQAPLFNNAALVELHHAGFGAHHHVAVVGDAVAGRAQPVAIEGGADAAAIAEHQQGRAIPGLLQASVVLVKGLDLGATLQLGLLAEGLRHQGQQAVGDGPAAAHHQFEGGIEVGRITESRIDHRLEVTGRIPPNRIEVGFGRPGPVDVAKQGVDLPVVAQQPHRLGQGPAGQGVGAEAAVVHRKTDGETGIAQVAVEGGQHLGAHHPLVHKGAAAEGGEIEVKGAGSPGLPRPVANPTPQPEQQGFEGITLGGRPVGGRTDQPLLNRRGRLPGHGAKHGGVHGNLPPTEAGQPHVGGFRVAELAGLRTPGRIGGQEHHAQAPGAAAAGLGLGPHRLQVVPGNATEDAGAIAGIAVATAAAAVLHAIEGPQGLGQDPMARLSLQMGKKPDPAGVLFASHGGRSRAIAMGPLGTGGQRHSQATTCVWNGTSTGVEHPQKNRI